MANTSPITIISQPPYRRHVALRRRRTVAAWAVERAVRYAKAWLEQPVRVSRRRHAAIAAGSGTVAVLAGVIAQVVVR